MVVALCIGIIKQAFIGLVRLVGWKKSNKAAGSSAAFPYIFVKAGMVLFYFLGSKVNQEKQRDLIGENNSWANFKTRIASIFHFPFRDVCKTHQGSKSYADGFVKSANMEEADVKDSPNLTIVPFLTESFRSIFSFWFFGFFGD